MASFRKISNLLPIKEADRIELAVVDGWQVIVEKGKYAVGDTIIFVEVDAWVPLEVAPFLQKGSRKEYKGVQGNRLKTIKLRGVLSQGLVLPVSALNAPSCFVPELGADVSQHLNIQKWERELPAQLAGKAKGYFPTFIRKTDQERVQNIWKDIEEDTAFYHGTEWEISEKLDGSSMTVYFYQGQFGVCSRNLELQYDENNSFWQAAEKYRLEQVLRRLFATTGSEYAFQGELVGPGIQGNPYNLDELHFVVFDIWDIKEQCYLSPMGRRWLLDDVPRLEHVPYVDGKLPNTLVETLSMADGTSDYAGNTVAREGIVFKMHEYPHYSFKAISNNWLLSEGA